MLCYVDIDRDTGQQHLQPGWDLESSSPEMHYNHTGHMQLSSQ